MNDEQEIIDLTDFLKPSSYCRCVNQPCKEHVARKMTPKRLYKIWLRAAPNSKKLVYINGKLMNETNTQTA